MNNLMYFSQEDSKNITIERSPDAILINPELYVRVMTDPQQNMRVLLDTPLLQFSNQYTKNRKNRLVPRSSSSSYTKYTKNRLVTRSRASYSLGITPPETIVSFITNAAMTADFNEMSSDDFIKNYLRPLNDTLKRTNISLPHLELSYSRPIGNPTDVENGIQGYYSGNVTPKLKLLYNNIFGSKSYFGMPSLSRDPLYTTKSFEPDIVHYLTDLEDQNLDICIALGNFKTGSYYLKKGFAELKAVISKYKLNSAKDRKLRLYNNRPLFEVEWSEGIVFALSFRKYLYQAFISGTDRVFISDHENFSGFFQYQFTDNGKMTINYYIINNPESIKDGITLRSAIAGFFYKDRTEALKTNDILDNYIEIAIRTDERDMLSYFCKVSQDKSINFSPSLPPIKAKEGDEEEEEVIEGNTICYVVSDSKRNFPELILPKVVFVKLYHYSSRSWDMHSLMCCGIPTRKKYYAMFFNELRINEILATSKNASKFPKILASGYWNGFASHPMHIFEYLGKELPESRWNKEGVYESTKAIIEELHSLGITHNGIRISNIYLPVNGRVRLIDFGLSDSENNQERKRRDLETLDEIFGVSDNSITYKSEN